MTTSLGFTKIKYDGKKVELTWTTKKLYREVEHHLKDHERPAPEFAQAMKAFIPLVLDLLELPDDYKAGLKVTGISINQEEGDGRMGIVVTCQRELAATNAPVVFNTPHLRERKDKDQGERGWIPDDWYSRIERAQSCAQNYVEGEREQRGIFDGKEAAAGELAGAPA